MIWKRNSGEKLQEDVLKFGSVYDPVQELFFDIEGPALMAVWSKVSPVTACCLSPLPGFESRPGHVRKLPVTWG